VTAQTAQRLRREARIMASLRHEPARCLRHADG
jgi:hypothetical protein